MSEPWSSVMTVTPEVTDICNKLRKHMEAMAGTTFELYTPSSFAHQNLEEGKQYVVKVVVGPDKCVHAMIAAFTGTHTVLRVQYPKGLIDPLVPF